MCRSGLDALSGNTWGKENGCSVPENGQIMGVPSRAGNWFGFGELYLYVLHSF